MHYVYMIKDTNDKLYVGISENPDKRVLYHNQQRGALFTKQSNNFQVVFKEEYNSLMEARKREIQIKKWNRKKKEMLIKRYKSGLPTKLKER